MQSVAYPSHARKQVAAGRWNPISPAASHDPNEATNTYCRDCGVTLNRNTLSPRFTAISVSCPTFSASIANV